MQVDLTLLTCFRAHHSYKRDPRIMTETVKNAAGSRELEAGHYDRPLNNCALTCIASGLLLREWKTIDVSYKTSVKQI